MAAIYRNGIQYSAGATATFDAVPTEGSPNPITSGAIFEYMSSFQDKLTFDESPTANSTNPVTSDGIKTAIDTKNDQITISSDSNALTDASTVLSASTGENPTAMASHALSKFWTYISGKITGAISGLLTTNLTPSKAMTSDANGKVSTSNTTSTELSYLHGVTGAVQTQLDGISDNIAPTEGATASGAYTAGSYIIWQDGDMYQVTANVSQGTTWDVGTNLSKVSVGSELYGLNGRITYGTADMTPGTTPLADGSLYFQYE